MKIISVTAEAIAFNDGSKITFDHCPDCCEWNYADFNQIEDVALTTEFLGELEFVSINGYGFRFRAPNTQWFFIPCYSEQDGYYSNDITIYYKNKQVLFFGAEGLYP